MSRWLATLVLLATACGESAAPTPPDRGRERPVVEGPAPPTPEPGPATGAPPRRDVPTVGTFGGERCTASEPRTATTHVARALALLAVGEGALLAYQSARQGRVEVLRLDADGAGGEPIDSGIVLGDDVQRSDLAELALVAFEGGALALSLARAGGAVTLGGVALDAEGHARAAPIEPVSLGRGYAGGIRALAADDGGAFVVHGTPTTAAWLERWRLAEGALTRTPLAELARGAPVALAVRGEHHALVLERRGRLDLYVDDHPGVRLEGRPPVALALTEEDGAPVARLRWTGSDGRTVSARVAAPWPDGSLTGSPAPLSLPTRLRLETPMAIEVRPADGGRELELARLTLDRGRSLARPLPIHPRRSYVSSNEGPPLYDAVWTGEQALSAWAYGAGVQVRTFRCE